ncbi:hypothetical protein P152DRAFT_462317 [Eremomyces bilateralis CBS 781.70]|uniref:BTB domain-containing protein n=1 Tax=Eremomyces bilateralis CBS 781.70 TaxID=1392243 RepID=A0A6G1FS31_9PEZI|nr:uncharacterized protein P152DRAFT_462317 [Eremomyces bilateralis CBS 781.70]KAF1808594.1 hypothetical protein P152DRAFT_462317 [Eremomyces bilateralis CBS 781.70]
MISQLLSTENEDVSAGKLRDDNPLDESESFHELCEACRRGDLKICQEKILEGVNINGRDSYDYTPLILASLCGHYEVAHLLLESGAICERDTHQGERCLHNALNDRIRNLLRSYHFSKSTDPLQPFAAHVTSLLSRDTPRTSDITLVCTDCTFRLHKLVLAARSPYFAETFAAAPETVSWRLPNTIPSRSLEIAVRYLYFGDVAADLGDGEEEQKILTGVEKLSQLFQTESLFESIMERDLRFVRQRRTDDLALGRQRFEVWLNDSVLANKVEVETSRAKDVRWGRNNKVFADVLLQADELVEEEDNDLESYSGTTTPRIRNTEGSLNGIPVGPVSPSKRPRRSILYPVHKAMLIRAEYFLIMFSSGFKEAQETEHLQIISVDFPPDVLEIVLAFLYSEKADIPLSLAVDVLWAADQLFIDKLKNKTAVIISTLGSGDAVTGKAEKRRRADEDDGVIDIYEVIRAGWDTRVPQLEEFGARYLAYRLERHIDTEEFAEMVQDSAARIQSRQETDTVELIDDIRFYLSERFRLRFEEAGLEEMMDDLEGSAGDAQDATEGQFQEERGIDSAERYAPSDAIPPTRVAANGVIKSDALDGTVIRTLDGKIAGDEFSQEAMDYRILLTKLDQLLEKLELDA